MAREKDIYTNTIYTVNMHSLPFEWQKNDKFGKQFYVAARLGSHTSGYKKLNHDRKNMF